MLKHVALAAMLLLGLLVPAARAEPQTVRVQLVRALAQAPYYIAVANGYFEKEGITIESPNVRSALDTIAPLATGQLDVSYRRRDRRLFQRRASAASTCASSRRWAIRGR